MKLFIVLACIFALTAADHGKNAKDGKNAKNSKNSICSKQLSVKPEDCCSGMPSFKQYFAGCAAQCNVTLPAAGPPAKPASGKQEKGGKTGNDQIFKCVMPCVLKAANVLGADGNITSAALNAALLKGVSADWTSIVPNVTAVCIANGKLMDFALMEVTL